MTPTQAPSQGLWARVAPWLGERIALIAISLFTLALLASSRNIDLPTLYAILDEASVLSMLTLGLTLLFYAGEFDISVGAVFALCVVCTALGTTYLGFTFGIGLALIVATLAGLANGLMALHFKLGLLLSFVMAVLWRELATWLGAPLASSTSPRELAARGGAALWDHWLGLPLPVWLVLAGYVALSLIARETVLIDRVLALGSRAERERGLDLPFNRIRLLLYTLAALSAGMAGILYFARLDTVNVNIDFSAPLEGLAALIIGNQGLDRHRARPLTVLCSIFALTALKIAIESVPEFPVPFPGVAAALVLVTLAMAQRWRAPRTSSSKLPGGGLRLD